MVKCRSFVWRPRKRCEENRESYLKGWNTRRYHWPIFTKKPRKMIRRWWSEAAAFEGCWPVTSCRCDDHQRKVPRWIPPHLLVAKHKLEALKQAMTFLLCAHASSEKHQHCIRTFLLHHWVFWYIVWRPSRAASHVSCSHVALGCIDPMTVRSQVKSRAWTAPSVSPDRHKKE